LTEGLCLKDQIPVDEDDSSDIEEKPDNLEIEIEPETETNKDEPQSEQDKINLDEELTLQKDEFPHCADFDIDAQKNQVLSCVSCENQYKLVSDICYPDDMPMKCIMFKEFLMKNKPEEDSNESSLTTEKEKDLCLDVDSDTKMCNDCKPGARLTVCGNCVSANLAGGRQCLYDFEMSEDDNERPMFYCQEGRFLKKPSYVLRNRNNKQAKIQADKNTMIMMPPSFREIINMLKRPLYSD